jgi:hypothetical protein
MDTKICKYCYQETSEYGLDADQSAVCYPCCAQQDQEFMKTHDKIVLYLEYNDLVDQNELNRPEWAVTNWPSSLRIKAKVWTRINPNTIWRIRHEVYFTDSTGQKWYGCHQGDNNDLVYCRKLKH